MTVLATFTPSWTDDAAGARVVIAPQCLARGSVVRALLDLSASKWGAYLYLALGRGGTTALTNGVNVEVRRNLKGGAILWPGGPWWSNLSDTVAAYLKAVNNGAGYAADTVAMEVDGTGTPAGDEDLCFWGATAIPAGGTALPNLEFCRVSKFAGTTLTVDAGIKVAKVDNELFANKSNLWPPIWCPGGAVYGVLFDYGDDAAGESVAVVAYAQVLDSEQAA